MDVCLSRPARAAKLTPTLATGFQDSWYSELPNPDRRNSAPFRGGFILINGARTTMRNFYSGWNSLPARTVDDEQRGGRIELEALMLRVRKAAETADTLSRTSHQFLYIGLADAARLAALVQRDDEAWLVFTSDSYFAVAPPRHDALFWVVRYMFNVASLEERQRVSRYTSALRFFLEVKQVKFDELVEAIHAQKGGLTGAARLYAEHRRQTGKRRASRPTAESDDGSAPRDIDLLGMPVKASRQVRDLLLTAGNQSVDTAFLLGAIRRGDEMLITSAVRHSIETVDQHRG
jgi:hypothetical protein